MCAGNAVVVLWLALSLVFSIRGTTKWYKGFPFKTPNIKGSSKETLVSLLLFLSKFIQI